MKRQYLGFGSVFATLIIMLAVVGFSFSAPSTSPAFSQNPTATPADPGWLAFSRVRDAIEAERGVSLRPIVQRWEYAQEAWDYPAPYREDRAFGIDQCNLDIHIEDARNVFWGFVVTITAMNGQVYQGRTSLDLFDVVVCTEPINAPAPQPPAGGGDGSGGSAPPPVTGGGATGGFELGGHVDGLSAQAISAMNSARMTWVKKQVNLKFFGEEAGFDFINDAHNNGFKIALGTVGDKNLLAADPEGYGTDFCNLLGSYAAAGADAIEVWNEPNLDREWPTGQVNGANFVNQILAPCFNAIKTANPNTMVISGAPSPSGFWGTAGCGADGCNDDVFMQQMANAGAANYMDCLGLHYNEGIISPTLSSGDPRGNYPTYYFGSMTNRGRQFFPNRPVCYTELGYLSGQGFNTAIPANFAWAANTTVAQQAQWLGEAATIARGWGYVRLMIVWNVNFTRFTDNDPMGGYAIIRPDASCPACGTLAAAMG